MKKIKLEVKKYNGDSKKDYALFRLDRIKPICAGITKAHANHLLKIVSKMDEVPENIVPIKEWYNYDEIIDVDENNEKEKE